MRKFNFLFAALLLASSALAQPTVEHWWFNTNGDTYNGVLTDVEAVSYNNNYIYVESSGIPSYFVNYAGHSLFQPVDQDYTFRIQREPQEETGTRTTLFTGAIGVGVDGSPFFHHGDAKSWDGSGFTQSGYDIWHSLAWEYEGLDMDGSHGHSTAQNVYHHHVGNVELFDRTDSTQHSPLVGFAFDGFPIYGPYGYASAYDSTSGITRMTSSYQVRNITARTSLPDGTALTNPSDWGPTINNSYPLGSLEEDYEYVDGSGTLDTLNGRWCITPEYPCGTYAYFVAIDANLDPDFPYMIGPEYKGVTDFSVGNQYSNANIPANANAYTVGTNICSTTITPTASDPSCTGNDGSISVAVDGFGNEDICYSWSNGATGSNITGLGSGTFTVQVSGDGCEDTLQVTLNNTSASTATLTGTDPSACGSADGTIQFGMPSGTGPFQFSIDSGTTYSTTPSFNSLSAGTYVTVLQDGNGCLTYGSVTLNGGSAVSITSTSVGNTNCGNNDGSITITATGGGSFTYSIDGGSTYQSSNSFTNLSAGTYTVIALDSTGCSDATTATLINTNYVNIANTSLADPSCGASDGSISITVSGGGSVSYSVDGGASFQASNSFSNLGSGTYTLVVSDTSGCGDTTTVTLNNSNAVSITNTTPVDPTCGTNDGSITVMASGAGSYTYSVDGGANYQSGNAFSNLAAGTYTVVALGGNGCSDTTTVTLTNIGSATSTLSTVDPSCGGIDGAIQFGMPNGSGPFMFSIDSGATYTSTPVFNNLGTGTYVTVLQDGNGCLTYQTVTLSGGAAVTLTNVSTNDLSCNGSADGSISITASGGTSYSIDGGNNYQSSNSFTGLSAGMYTVIASDSSGCADTTTVSLTEPTAISINGNVIDETMPSNGSVDITVAGGTPPYSYSWTPGGMNSEDLNGVAGNTTYEVTVTDANGCTLSESFFVDSSVGFGELSEESSVTLYPNPTNNMLNFSGAAVAGVQVFDLTGKLVMNEGPTTTLQLLDLEQGSYFVVTELTDGSMEQHIIVKQ